MKCPKCGYTSFDYLDTCRKCGTDLREIRVHLQVIAVSPEARAPRAPSPAPPAEPSPIAAYAEAGREIGEPAVAPPAGQEAILEDLNFEDTFDTMVEPTSHRDKVEAPPPEKGAEDEILELDFGDVFGDNEAADK